MPANLPSSTLFFILILCAAAAQERPAPDALRISVEEVRVPVAAYDAGGRFDHALSADDLLVREGGVAQQVKGVFRVAADVLLLLDTGGDTNPAKSLRLTLRSRRGYVVKDK